MEARIQFIKGLDEKVHVRLTRSRDLVATFTFNNPNILDKNSPKKEKLLVCI